MLTLVNLVDRSWREDPERHGSAQAYPMDQVVGYLQNRALGGVGGEREALIKWFQARESVTLWNLNVGARL